MLKKTLMDKSRAYCEKRGISLSKLGTLVLKDTKFFSRVIDGKNFTDKSYDRILAYIADNPVRRRKIDA